MAVTPRTIRVVVAGVQENTQRQTVLHFKTNADHTWTQAELLQFCTNFWNDVRLAWKACVGTTVNFLSVTATDLSIIPPQQGVYSIPQPEPGTIGGEAVPANVACCISWKTLFTGRSYRGRTYLYGLTESNTNGSILNTAYLVAVATLAQRIVAWTNPAGVVALFAVRSSEGGFSTLVNTFIVDNVSDSQRRRLPNRGA